MGYFFIVFHSLANRQNFAEPLDISKQDSTFGSLLKLASVHNVSK